MNKNLNILLLDDHSLFSNGLKQILSVECEDCVISSYNSIAELMNYHPSLEKLNKFDIFISDLEIPNENTFDFLTEVRKKSEIPILIISSHDKIVAINKCQKLGVDGYILKNDERFLVSAINEILNGNHFYSPQIKTLINSSLSQNSSLSERELEIIKHICKGTPNQTIADNLNLKLETIKSHKRNIKLKLGYSSTFEVINFAKENMIL